MKNIVRSLMLVVAFAMISQDNLIAITPTSNLKQSTCLQDENAVKQWLENQAQQENISQDTFAKVITAFSEQTTIGNTKDVDKMATTIVEKFAQDSTSIDGLQKALNFLNKVQTDKSNLEKQILDRINAITNPTINPETTSSDGETNVAGYSSKLWEFVKTALSGSKNFASNLVTTADEFGKALGGQELEKQGDDETLTADTIKSSFSKLINGAKTNNKQVITAMVVIALAIEEIKTGGFLSKEACSLLSQGFGLSTEQISNLFSGPFELLDKGIITKQIKDVVEEVVKENSYSLMDFVKRVTFYKDFFGK